MKLHANIRVTALFTALLMFPCQLSYAETSHSTDTSICSSLQASLSPGTLLKARSIADALAANSNSRLRMNNPQRVGDFSLKSTYSGSLSCQRNTLYRVSAAGSVQVAMPQHFAGGEGALCSGDRVRLVTLLDNPALLEEGDRGTTTTITLSIWSKGAWSLPCHVAVTWRPEYGVREEFCAEDKACSKLRRLAVEISNTRHESPWTDTLESQWYKDEMSEQKTWTKMLELADQQGILQETLPTLGRDTENYSDGRPHTYYVHSFVNSEFVPLEVDGKLLLGKIGLAGVAYRTGSAELLSVYQLEGDRLNPIAGFYLDVIGKTVLTSALLSTAPGKD